MDTVPIKKGAEKDPQKCGMPEELPNSCCPKGSLQYRGWEAKIPGFVLVTQRDSYSMTSPPSPCSSPGWNIDLN